MHVQPLTIKNARVWDGQGAVERDLYTSDVILDKPHPNAITVDLSGYTVFPGLINAHDHLELNHFPRTKYRERYDNAHQWGEDVQARLDESPFRELRAYRLEDRLFIGGIKNLLCGATTVAHHNPPHKPLFRKDFPVRVLKKYGWAHSLHFSTDEEAVRSYRSTPPDVPWFIHLAEGTDDVAAREYQRLKALGCVGTNTVIVHGVGMTDEDVADAAPKVRGLVWCPTTNIYLLDWQPYDAAKKQWFHVRWYKAGGNLALGSDSRLSAEGDLLHDMKKISHLGTVTTEPMKILGLQDVGHLNHAAQADWIAIHWAYEKEQGESGYNSTDDYYYTMDALRYKSLRSDLALIVRGGIPQIGDPELMAKFPHIEKVEAKLDHVDKLINVDLARQVINCSLKEPGLELLGKPKPRFFALK